MPKRARIRGIDDSGKPCSRAGAGKTIRAERNMLSDGTERESGAVSDLDSQLAAHVYRRLPAERRRVGRHGMGKCRGAWRSDPALGTLFSGTGNGGHRPFRPHVGGGVTRSIVLRQGMAGPHSLWKPICSFMRGRRK